MRWGPIFVDCKLLSSDFQKCPAYPPVIFITRYTGYFGLGVGTKRAERYE